MESILAYIVMGVCLLLTIILFAILSPKAMTVLRNIQKLKIDINNPYLPDYVIHKDQPIRFPITNKKCVYLQPMSMALYTVFVDKMAQFFISFKEFLEPIEMNKSLSQITNSDSETLMGLFKSPKARYEFLEIMKDTILRDPAVNRDKVKWKELIKIDISTVIQLFVVVYDRNITCVKSFIGSLLERLAEGQAKQKAGLGLWSLQDNQWMLSQLTQSLKQDLSSLEKPNKDNEKPTRLIEV
jgi:hypothetical protein